MKKSKNSVTLALMLSSIILLLVLQFLWLRSSYNKAFDDFRKETNLLFRNTVLAMRDSIIERSIEPLPGDTLPVKNLVFHSFDSLRFSEQLPDSAIERLSRHERISRVQVLVSPDESDSISENIRPLVSRFYNARRQGNFILRLGPDSLKMDSVYRHFRTALSIAGIDLPFHVIQMKRGENGPLSKKGLHLSEQVRINGVNRYAVSFSEVNNLLMREIIPQILFSALLTMLTIGSFYMMYRSILTQQRMAELKNDFISNVTHELKTPITTVQVALEALQDFKGFDNPKVTREYLEIAQNELTRLTLLTDKVLKTAIFEKNGVAFQPESVDLEKLAEEVLASMKPVFEKSNAKVTLRKEGTDFTLWGSADHLTNVLYNLLDNALKYSAANPEIEVLVKTEAGSVELSVQDNGQGIPSEYHKKIFEKFFRVPTGDVHNVKGYGLGLNYVASVVRSHRGTIEVESEPGKGSRFYMTLPKG